MYRKDHREVEGEEPLPPNSEEPIDREQERINIDHLKPIPVRSLRIPDDNDDL